jgi:hypothetical protein
MRTIVVTPDEGAIFLRRRALVDRDPARRQPIARTIRDNLPQWRRTLARREDWAHHSFAITEGRPFDLSRDRGSKFIKGRNS